MDLHRQVVAGVQKFKEQWKRGKRRVATDEALGIGRGRPKLVAGAPSGVNSNASISAQPGALYEIGFVTAEILGFNGDYRAAINTVNRYVANLRADTRVAAVEVLQEPVNVSSFVDLKGSTADEQSMLTQSAHFKLKVILKSADQLQSGSAEVNQP